MIDEHLLNITEIQAAGKVMLDFAKTPKKFTYCRYPLLLCCLICEFSEKCKKRFPVYESFFNQIYNSFAKSGQLFVDKIRKDSILEYHLNQKDLRGRDCLHIMSQNKLYLMLEDSDVAAIIGKYWSGSSIQLGLIKFSSFYYLNKNKLYKNFFNLEHFNLDYISQNTFFFNYYSFRNISSIRYYFKEAWNLIIVFSLMILIYFSVQDKSLKYTKNNKYYILQTIVHYGIYTYIINKLSSLVFFLNVEKWWKEIDNNILDFILVISNCIHFNNALDWLIKDLNTINRNLNNSIIYISDSNKDIYDSRKELLDSLVLSTIILIMWYKVLNSLNAFKLLGGFIRTMILLVKKMFFIVIFFYSFIFMFTGIFNMYFTTTSKFKEYMDTWFYLFQTSLQEFSFEEDFTLPLKFSISIFAVVCTAILINLIIAYSTNIYKAVDENVDAEYRASLISIHEYLKWNDKYGIFKFYHAPLNIFQIPFYILLFFTERKVYWNEMFCLILYLILALIYFIMFIFINTFLMIFSMIYSVCYLFFNLKFRYLTKYLIIGAFINVYYFVFDCIYFWRYTYCKQNNYEKNEEEEVKNKIDNIKNLFTDLVTEISERIKSEKSRNEISLTDFVKGWLLNITTMFSCNTVIDENKIHKKTFLMSKYKRNLEHENIIEKNTKLNLRYTYQTLLSKKTNHTTIYQNLKHILTFLEKFTNSENKIDIELAKNLFPVRTFYDEEYFKFLYYFHFENFGGLLKNTNKDDYEERKEINKLRCVFSDLDKISNKFLYMKHSLKMLNIEEFELLEFNLKNVNNSFSVLEKSLVDAKNKDEINKIMFKSSKTYTIKNKKLSE